MPNRNRILFGLMLIALVAVPLRAYRLALKDGKTVQFEKYRTTETMLFYTGMDGKEIGIPLTDVDLDRTQQLNAQEAVPLDLPGLGATKTTSPLMGEIARRQQKNAGGPTAKRVFTDDDVVHSSPVPPSVQIIPSDATQASSEPIQKIIDKLANKTQTRLASEVVGDIQFPGRDAWEQKLYAQAQRVLKFAQGYLDRSRKLDTIADPAERSAAIETAKNFEAQVNVEETVYTQISVDGSQKAKESETQPR
jgi:hypothetical protein